MAGSVLVDPSIVPAGTSTKSPATDDVQAATGRSPGATAAGPIATLAPACDDRSPSLRQLVGWLSSRSPHGPVPHRPRLPPRRQRLGRRAGRGGQRGEGGVGPRPRRVLVR